MSCGQRQIVMHISQYLLYWVFYTWLRLTSNNSISFDDILFKAPIPRQGNHLIGDFRDDINYHLKVFQPNINNLIKDRFNPSLIVVTDLTAISNIIFRVANSKFNYITNCPIAFATTIECTPATDVQFNALHTDLIYVYSSS